MPRERTEHSVMEGLPEWKAERIAGMRRELAELQRQLIDAQQRIAAELQGRADDAERYEALEARLQAQDTEWRQRGARMAELDNEIAGLRAMTEKLREQITSREGQVEEARQQHRNVIEQLEGHRALLATRDAELATRTTERDTARSQLERHDEERKQHQAIAEQLELQTKAVTEARALVETHDTELAAIKSERDALKGESEQARRELDAARAKARDVANQLARFGQELLDGSVAPRTDTEAKTSEPSPTASSSIVPPLPKRTRPPTPPQRRSASIDVATILDVTADAKPASSRAGSVLLMVGGVVLGCLATILIMNWTSTRSTAAAAQPDPSVEPSPVIPSETPPAAIGAEVAAPPAEPAPVAVEGVAEVKETPPTAEAPVTGTVQLPPEAAGHRLFVDGKVVEVNDSRAVVGCGPREIKMGSRGAPQTIDVACGGTTEVPALKK
jgi:hypothetical protein